MPGQDSTVLLALLVLLATAWPVAKLGSEFMPTLNEGTLLYMPVTLPGLSVTKAAQLLQTQDRIIKSFPEVESVFGKAGRANKGARPGQLVGVQRAAGAGHGQAARPRRLPGASGGALPPLIEPR
jgi:Cu/Ag efflux pump CusA